MICYKEEKRDKASKGGEPVERTHGEIVVLALPEGKLRREVGEREEPVRSVEFLIVFAVTALNLAVVAGSVRPYEFVLDAEFGKGFLKERRTVRFGIVQPVGELNRCRSGYTQWHRGISQQHGEGRGWKNRCCVPQRLRDSGSGNTHQ